MNPFKLELKLLGVQDLLTLALISTFTFSFIFPFRFISRPRSLKPHAQIPSLNPDPTFLTEASSEVERAVTADRQLPPGGLPTRPAVQAEAAVAAKGPLSGRRHCPDSLVQWAWGAGGLEGLEGAWSREMDRLAT